nr:heme-degrading domain-containing protein [Azomonas macrocytogenes]
MLKQETQLHLPGFDLVAAWQLGQLLYQYAAAVQAPAVLEIHAYGRIVFSAALPGSNADNHDWVRRKRNTVLRYGHSSLYLGEYNRSRGREFETQPHIDAKKYAAHGGSFPLRLAGGGELIGAVTLSGLPPQEDHQLVIDVLQAWLKVAGT